MKTTIMSCNIFAFQQQFSPQWQILVTNIKCLLIQNISTEYLIFHKYYDTLYLYINLYNVYAMNSIKLSVKRISTHMIPQKKHKEILKDVNNGC